MNVQININNITEENRFEKIEKFNEIERIMKGIVNLPTKQIINKNGKRQTVHYRPDENISNIQSHRIELANKAPLIKGIFPLKITPQNYKLLGNEEISKIETEIKNGLVCACLNKKVTRINKIHIYKKQGKDRVFKDIINHVPYLPFVIQTIKNGITDDSKIRIDNKGQKYYEVISRAEITENKRIGISVILVEGKKELEATFISIFRIEDNKRLIKASSSSEPLLDAHTIYGGPERLAFINGSNNEKEHNISFFNNLSISDSLNKSSETSQININNITEENKFEKIKKFNEIEDILKSHKYIRRWQDSNGKWNYEYPKHFLMVSRTKAKIELAKQTKLITGIRPIFNADKSKVYNYLGLLKQKGDKGNLRCSALGNQNILINEKTYKHFKETNGNRRTNEAISHKAKYLPFVEQILRYGKIAEKSSSKKGVIYGIIGQIQYYDNAENKIKKEAIEIAINYDSKKRKFFFSISGNEEIKKSSLLNEDLYGCFLVSQIPSKNTLNITNDSLTCSLKKSSENSQIFNNIKFNINYSTNTEALLKINKALRIASFSLDVPLKARSGEAFTYKAQEELTNNFIKELTDKTKKIYEFVISYFGLPEKRILVKAELKYKGNIIYNPENGEPITQAQWKKFVKELEDFINKNYSGIGEKIVLSSQALGRILERLSKTNSKTEIEKIALEELNYKHRSFDYISSTVKNMKNVFDESFDRYTQAKIQVAIDSAAQRVTRVTDEMKNNIQQIIIDGIKNRQSKSKVSQNLFDKCVGLNRDFQKIADTEIQNNTTSAYIQEEVYHTSDNEKVYFKRFAKIDDNTCKVCKAQKGIIALYSDTPLENEKIKDEYATIAIWEGKIDGVPFTINHPYCRCGWFRYYPEVDSLSKAIYNRDWHGRFAPKNYAIDGISGNKNKEGSAASTSTNEESSGATSAQNLHNNNISFLDNEQEKKDVKNKISKLEDRLSSNKFEPKEYLKELKTCFNAHDLDSSCYALQNINGNYCKLRISEHEAVVRNKQGNKTINTSIVIQLNKKRGRRNKTTKIIEYIYNPNSLDKGKQQDILNGIKNWIETGEFSGTQFDLKKSL